jgi:hypothetical protein
MSLCQEVHHGQAPASCPVPDIVFPERRLTAFSGRAPARTRAASGFAWTATGRIASEALEGSVTTTGLAVLFPPTVAFGREGGIEVGGLGRAVARALRARSRRRWVQSNP